MSREKRLMKINFGHCENKVDFLSRPARLDGMRFKFHKFGPVKIVLSYELYSVIENRTGFEKKIVNCGQHLESLEVNWVWKF